MTSRCNTFKCFLDLITDAEDFFLLVLNISCTEVEAADLLHMQEADSFQSAEKLGQLGPGLCRFLFSTCWQSLCRFFFFQELLIKFGDT